jgi:hypothetical protein
MGVRMITYAWAVNSMTAYPEAEGEQNVVFQIAWVLSATDGTYNAATYGTVDTTYVAGTPFTPYDQLTLDQANGWVADALGPDGIATAEAACDAMIAAQQVPDKPVTPPLPWNVPTPAPEPEPEPVEG